jgi:hypothetical protein
VCGSDEARQVGRVVGTVCIHLADEIWRLRQNVAHAGDVGTAEAVFGRAVQDIDATRRRAPQVVGHLTGAVRRPVVDDEDAETVVRQDT